MSVGKPPRYTGVGYFARRDLAGQRMFREARKAILGLWNQRDRTEETG